MIKKVIRQYLANDAQLMTNVSNVFSFFNASNTRRVNNVVNKNLFPMITINEFEKILEEGHQSGSTLAFKSTLEIQLDTIVDPDACNDKQIERLHEQEDEHEESADRIIRLLHALSGTVNGTLIGMCVFQDSQDSQLNYNLVNNDKDQVVYRKTLIFNINYEEGA